MRTAKRAKLRSVVTAAAVILLLGFHIPGFAQQYSVVANQNAGTVSLLKYVGGSWIPQGNPFGVGGKPCGIATYGQNVYVINESGYVSILKAVETETSAQLVQAQSRIDFDQSSTVAAGTRWGAVGSGGDRLYVTNAEKGLLWELRRNSGIWTKYGYEYLRWNDDISIPPNPTASRNPQGVIVVPSLKGGDDQVFVANAGVSYRNVTGVSGVKSFGGDGTVSTGWSTVEGGPLDLTLSDSPLGRYVFTTSPTYNKLASINPETGMLDTTSYDLGAVTPDALAAFGKYLFVAERDSRNVHRYVLDKDTGFQHAGTVDLQGRSILHRMTVSPDGSLLMVTNPGDNSLSWINISGDNFSFAGRRQGFDVPMGVAFVTPGPVPEPTTLAGLGIGLIAAFGATRRRIRKGERKGENRRRP